MASKDTQRGGVRAIFSTIFRDIFSNIFSSIFDDIVTAFAHLALTTNTTDSQGQLTNFTVSRDSAATFINPSGVLTTADGDGMGSSSTLMDETGFTGIQGSFVDGSAWLDGEVLGSEVVSNGGFDTDTIWTKVGNTTISGGEAQLNATAAYQYVLSQSNVVTNGKLYKVTFTITNYTSGNMRVRLGSELGATRDSPGTYTEYLVSSGTDVIFSAVSTAIVCSIDNVSIKEVTSKISTYANTGDLVIAQDSSGNKAYGFLGAAGSGEALSAELITNGDFTNWNLDDPDNWTVTGEVGSDPMVTEVSGQARMYSSSASLVLQQAILTAGKLYKYSTDVTAAADGGFWLRMGGDGNARTALTAVQTYADYLAAVGTYFSYKRQTGSGDDITIDNVSVKEVTEPPVTAAHVFKEYALTNEGWNAIDSSFDYNDITTFDVYANLYDAAGAGAATDTPRIEANGLLHEGEATNWCIYSNDLDQWTTTTVSSTQNITGPDGVANSAWTCEDQLVSPYDNEKILHGSLPNDGDATLSVFVKQGSSDVLSVRLNDNTASTIKGHVDFQWVAGALTIKTEVKGTGEVKEIGNGWWRAIVHAVDVVSGNDQTVYLCPSEFGVTPGSPVTTIFYGAQLEASPYATSYIPTQDIPVTRTADESMQWTMSTAFKNLMGNVANSPFTMVVELTPRLDITGYNAFFVNVAESTDEYLFKNQAATNLRSRDGTNTLSIAITGGMLSGITYTYALRVYDNSGMKMEIAEKHGGSWSAWSTPASYDGSFNPSTDLIVGYSNSYPFNIKNIYFFNDAKSQAWVEANF